MGSNFTKYELDLCVSCVYAVTYGPTDDETDAAHAALVARWGTDVNHIHVVGDEEPISWVRCTGCGSTLGGGRFPAVALVPA